jgi:deoxycytidine triphosphate deaminase
MSSPEESRTGAVLSDEEIIQDLKDNKIIISPYHSDLLGNCSYDVRLGENYYIPTVGSSKFLCPWSTKQMNSYWGSPKVAKKLDSSDCELYDLSSSFIGKQAIFIPENTTILGHTEEFIGSNSLSITTMMQCKSSIGRSCLSVCKCSSWSDIDYKNRFTFEITNHSNKIIILIVGEAIAQIVFLKTGLPTRRKYNTIGRYQNSDDIKEIIKTWSPDQMLPKPKKLRDHVEASPLKQLAHSQVTKEVIISTRSVDSSL